METSTTTKELITALCQFQSAQLKATKRSLNPAFKTKYSGVNEVLEAVLPTLTEVGLCFVQFPDGEALTTRLMHTSGEWMQASYALRPAQNTPQASGSALTYARRYALLAVLGLGTEDDDGQAASVPAPAQKAKPAHEPTPWDSDEIYRYLDFIQAAKSKIELREAWDKVPAGYRSYLKRDSLEAAVRIEAAVLQATASKV